jgi:hypothetical protein
MLITVISDAHDVLRIADVATDLSNFAVRRVTPDGMVMTLEGARVRTSGTQIYEGRGAFAGLRFVALFSVSPELARLNGDGYHVAGWIELAE